ncbi:hypothetical protein DZA66_14515 [Listeria innocua]|nr:hypothetical protein [Listeria innocua]EAG9437070.1 hypothetical protein [Listeria innocua]MBM5708074.1 hypothetical protein [Listeria innocua]
MIVKIKNTHVVIIKKTSIAVIINKKTISSGRPEKDCTSKANMQEIVLNIKMFLKENGNSSLKI